MSTQIRQAASARLGAYWAWNLSEGGVHCRLLSGPVIDPRNETPAQIWFSGLQWRAPPVGFEPTLPAPEGEATESPDHSGK
jgi:hypothetical protein